MTFDELMRAILDICPQAVFSDGPNGEVLISSGWIVTGGPDVPMIQVE